MKTTHPMTLALEWAARGIPAFPVEILELGGRTQKRPLTKNGHRDASVDIDTVRDMFVQASPSVGELAVGLVPGAGGFIVLDPDVKDGQDGPAFADGLGIPDGWLVITASGGQHRWFRKPDANVRYSNRTPPAWHGLIDIRADNGWVVAPGTVTRYGSWAAVAPWPAGGPPTAPAVVQAALWPSGASGEPTEAHRAGYMSDERRAELHPHTLAVYDWMVLNHGAHSPQIMTRVGEESYLTICRPGKRSGVSATVGFASPGALFIWSSNWPGIPANDTLYPLGHDPNPLGATAAPQPAITGTVVTPGAYFVRGSLQVTSVVRGLMARVPVAVDRHRNFWMYEGGRWALSPGKDLIGEQMYSMLGPQFRTSYVDSVAVGVQVEAARINPDDPNPAYLNLPNGMLDWASGELFGHAPEFHSINQLTTPWDPRAACPLFDTWVREVLPPDLTNGPGVPFVDLLLGYLIRSGNPMQLAVLLLGSGGNGKSVFIKILQRLIGTDNYSSVPLRDLDENRFRAALVYGKLANICGDLDARRLEGTDMFKKITGGDTITAEHKYGRGFEFASYAVPVFSANAVFGTPDTSEGYFRRWLIVPFPHSFVGREDSTLVDRLTSPGELAGILVRAVRGARELARLGRFPVPPSIAETRERFMEESDPVRSFMKDCLERNPGGPALPQKDVYDVYKVWADQAGRQTLSSGKLASRLAECGVTLGITHNRKVLRGQKLTVKVVYGELVPVVPIPAGQDPDDPLAGLVRPSMDS